MSRIMYVPASVPSETHSSLPLAPSLAWKKTRSWQAKTAPGSELLEPGRMSFTSAVPAAVPSELHSSAP